MVRVSTAIATSEGANWGVFLLGLSLLSLMAFLASTPSAKRSIEQIAWDQQEHCRQPIIGAPVERDELATNALTMFQGEALCRELAKQPALAEHFSSIHASWVMNDDHFQQAISEKRLHLLVARPEVAAAIPLMNSLYQPVAYYPVYEVFLVARDHMPKLDREYLQSQRIGLLSKTESRSGYIVPMRELHRAGVHISSLQLERYPGHTALREALERGEVDVIGSYWNASLSARFPMWQAKHIGEVTQGLNWFLDVELHEVRSVRCSVIKTLEVLADQSGTSYFADLRVIKSARADCDDH